MTESIRQMTFIEAVFNHPKMYTAEGSFLEVVAFLTGYVGGFSKMRPDAELVIEWGKFECWLAERMESDLTRVFNQFLIKYPDESNRMSEISRLYAEFRRDHSPSAGQKKPVTISTRRRTRSQRPRKPEPIAP